MKNLLIILLPILLITASESINKKVQFEFKEFEFKETNKNVSFIKIL